MIKWFDLIVADFYSLASNRFRMLHERFVDGYDRGECFVDELNLNTKLFYLALSCALGTEGSIFY